MRVAVIQKSLLWIAVFCCLSANAAGQTASVDAGHAVATVFSPRRAPAAKSMGLLQRSFLDLIESSRSRLEVALVVDGTDSMERDIAGVRRALREMATDLDNYRDGKVSFALIVYRDAAVKPNEVTRPVPTFTSDLDVLQKQFDRIQPLTGAPYFPEMVDLAIYEAIEDLNWSEDEQTSRWILLFADAPPYDEGFMEDKTGARRSKSTELLVELARQKKIQINGVLCRSDAEKFTSYETVLPKTRRFMSTLTTETGGLMLDLSDPAIRETVRKAAEVKTVPTRSIGRITPADVEAARKLADEDKLPVAKNRRISIAVLPHLPLESLDFNPALPEVQVTTELRHKLELLPSVELRSPVEISRQVRRLRDEGLPVDQWLPTLAARLGVDYIIWGSYVGARDGGVRQLRSVIFSRQTNKELQPLVVNNQPATQVVGLLVEQMTNANFMRNAAPDLRAALAAARSNQRILDELVTPVSTSSAARDDILQGYEALDQALAFEAGDAEAAPLLQQAQTALNRALAKQPRDPLALMLQANCLFNLARLETAAGNKQEAQQHVAAMHRALSQAYEERNRCRFQTVKREIMADYALLVSRNFEEAVSLYGELTAVGAQTPLPSALRAHWMLAGIHSGDWGVPGDAAVVDAALARKHLIHILAHWPESSQALYIRRNLRWKEDRGSQYQHVPLEHTAVLTAR